MRRGPYDIKRWFAIQRMLKEQKKPSEIARHFGVTPQAITMAMETEFPAEKQEMMDYLSERLEEDPDNEVIECIARIIAQVDEIPPAKMEAVA